MVVWCKIYMINKEDTNLKIFTSLKADTTLLIINDNLYITFL